MIGSRPEPPSVDFVMPVKVCGECGARRTYPDEPHNADCTQYPREDEEYYYKDEETTIDKETGEEV